MHFRKIKNYFFLGYTQYVTNNYWFSFTISCQSIFFKVYFWKVIQRQQVIFHICMYEFFPKLCIHLKKPGEQWITAQGIVAVTLTSTYIYVFSNIEWPCMSRYFLHFFVVLYYVKIHYLQYWWTALSLLHFKITLMYSSISFFQVFKTPWKNMTLRVESFTSTE